MVVLGVVLLALGAVVTVVNWLALVRWVRTRKHVSGIGFIGGLLGLAGCALIPAIGWKLGLIALVVDPLCAWTVPLLLFGPLIPLLRRRARPAANDAER